jgi:hypothetical protein
MLKAGTVEFSDTIKFLVFPYLFCILSMLGET